MVKHLLGTLVLLLVPTSNRASTTTSGFETTNNPTATRTTLISPTTRHLIHFGTETTIGTCSQHKMICL